VASSYIKNLLQTKKQFKQALKEFLHFHSYYSLNEFYNYNGTYLLTPWSRVPLEKLPGSVASQEIPAFLEPEGS
jgi:hypothetical protein